MIGDSLSSPDGGEQSRSLRHLFKTLFINRVLRTANGTAGFTILQVSF